MTPYCPLPACSLPNAPAPTLALVALGLFVVLIFAILVVVKLPRDSEWGELRLGLLVARWGRKQKR